MPTGSQKRLVPDLEALPGPHDVRPPDTAATPVDAASIAALRELFELLDEWDQRDKTDED